MSNVITREQLQNQLEIMQNQHNELGANLNASNGAIQMLQYLLSQLNDVSETEELNNGIEAGRSDKAGQGIEVPPGLDEQNGDGMGDAAGNKREIGQDIGTVGIQTKAQVKSKNKA